MKRSIKQITLLILVALLLISLVPMPASTAVTTNIISQGTTILKGGWYFNCENGAVSSTSGDIWWQQINTTTRYMTPIAPAKIYNLGIINFDAITAQYLDDRPYTSSPIVGSNNSTNKLVTNDVFAVKTKLGHFTKIKVVTYGYNMSIKWVTYRKPLTTPIPVSPANGQMMYQYPRAVTLAWKPVAGAVSYLIQRQYLSGSTWTSYPNASVTGFNNTSYTFNFIGDQQGRWRVIAYGTNTWSAASPWWTFAFSTAIQLPAPSLVSPSNGITFNHYPRTTTLAWKPVAGASAYKVEVQYYSASTWSNWKTVTISGVSTSSYTFTFVGAQPGRWRVTAIGSSPYRTSAPSVWRTFKYTI